MQWHNPMNNSVYKYTESIILCLFRRSSHKKEAVQKKVAKEVYLYGSIFTASITTLGH